MPTLAEFIRMTPFQKQRLRESDPEQYQKLFQAMESNFPKEDYSTANEISNVTAPNSVQTVE